MTEQDQIRSSLHKIARNIKFELPPLGWDFVLLVANCQPSCLTLYISSLEHADALQLMREYITSRPSA
jgi:hypothetical protein